MIEIHTDPADFNRVKTELEGGEGGLRFLGAEISFVPENTVSIEAQAGEQMENLIELLEELDEVQEVYSNYEILE